MKACKIVTHSATMQHEDIALVLKKRIKIMVRK